MPHYDLELVRRLAKAGSIRYGGRLVQRDIDNLDYQFKDVRRCLMEILPSDFCHTEDYGVKGKHDVYKIAFLPASREISDDLYIKLTVLGDEICISISSFHQQRR